MRRCWARVSPAVLHRCIRGKKRVVDVSSKLTLDVTKAGLSGVNKARVNKVIENCSKGSAFSLNEERLEAQRKERHMELLSKSEVYRHLSTAEKQTLRDKVETCEVELEAGRHFRNYVHVDMDMFYAAVEMKKNPSLVNVPLGVGTFDMLSTTNYVARRYGVRSGMPGYIGVKLCPSLVIVPTDFDAYHAEAAVVRGIAAAYDPNFTSVGLDELTMEVTAYLQQHPGMTAGDVASEFRARVFAETQLTASAGIGPTATLAKIASNYEKPNGQHELRLRTRQDVMEFMKNLPVRTVPGIGPVQEAALRILGIRTCGCLLRKKVLLFFLFPEKTFRFYLSAGLGVVRNNADRTRSDRTQKTMGHEITFKRRLKSEAELKQIVLKVLVAVHTTLLLRRAAAQRVTLHMKRRTFENHQFTLTLGEATNDFAALRKATWKLLQPHLASFDNFRLVGVRLGKLQSISRKKLISGEEKRKRCPPAGITASVLSVERPPKTVALTRLLNAPSDKMKRVIFCI
ncbi:DNA polymerase kappa, putative,DNA polymerase IV, putative [Trypanosoma cruzi marinkellei]|uniref:DNA polymerase kappa n=1 Tax=Trypanosoma cruzi marinkellei TaxID=85056 RepID=K2NL41_TRYCR|nr:DNA polymerase kappa, putative,DNA polymerase IV, putative [Trypanosoma cruzi marinkellei]